MKFFFWIIRNLQQSPRSHRRNSQHYSQKSEKSSERTNKQAKHKYAEGEREWRKNWCDWWQQKKEVALKINYGIMMTTKIVITKICCIFIWIAHCYNCETWHRHQFHLFAHFRSLSLCIDQSIHCWLAIVLLRPVLPTSFLSIWFVMK